MKPPRGIKVSKPYRHEDLLIMYITVARWRIWYEIARRLLHARIRIHIEV